VPDATTSRVAERVGLVLATCGHVGYAPIAPGTAGSVVGIVAFYLLRAFASPPVEIATILLLLVVGIWSATIGERRLGIDPGPVVIDEVVGMLVTLALVPVTFAGVVVAFVVFRLFDIVKPWPANRLEALPSGLGIMADDVMAGVYGNLVIRGLALVFPGWLM